MEIIRGKQTSFINASILAERLQGYDAAYLDIGTGDGRFVQHMARTCPNTFVIGVDACRENLREVSRQAPPNALFAIANARAMPLELAGLAARVTINFPWGSLLEGLLNNDAGLMAGLEMVMQTDAALDVRLNGGALSEVGWLLEAGSQRIFDMLAANSFAVQPPTLLTVADLKAYPTTWAKRLAFGRDPRATFLRGAKRADISVRAGDIAALITLS